MEAAAPATENSRLELLRMLDILDTAAEPAFDALVRAASAICACPISLMSLVDIDRQWFKAQVGIEARQTPRSQAFCAHAIRDDVLFEIPDATTDVRFADNPLVTGDTQIRFYAGQPILYDGVALGTLCVIDRVPRRLDDHQRAQLRNLSLVMAELLHGRMEALLHRREAQRLTDYAQLSGDWLWESDVLHRRTWVSGDETKASGLFHSTLLGDRFRDLAVLDWVGRPTTGPDLLGLLDRGEAFSNAVVETFDADGRRYVSLSAVPMCGTRGEPAGFRGSAKDVTEHIAAEVHRREREGLLRKITGQVPGSIHQFRLAPSGAESFTFASEGIRDVFELSPDDALRDASLVFGRVHPDDAASVRAGIAASQATGGAWHARFRVVLPVKGLRWLQGASVPERQPDGGTLWSGYIMDVTESHARDRELADAHRALVASERRVRAVTDNMPAMIAHVGRDERYTFANAAIGDVFGIDATSLIGRSMRDVRDEPRYALIKPHIDLALAGERTTFEGSSDVGGRHYYFQSVYVPDVGADGEVLGFYSMTFDLTRRKNAELRQAESEKLLRGITDNLPALVCYVGTDDRYRFANGTYAAWLGLDQHAMVGRSYRDFFDDASIAAIEPYVRRGRAGERIGYERTIRHDGMERTLFVEYVPDFDEHGTVLGLFAMSTDITERRRTEQRLIDGEQRLRDITNNMPALIGQFDMDGRTVFANDLGLREYGLVRDAVPDLTFRSHIGEDMYREHEPVIRRALAGESGIAHGRREHDGKTRFFEAHFIPQRDRAGVQRGFYVMSFDVTSLKSAQAERERSEARLRQITDALPVLITYIDAQERMTYMNETFRRWLGVTDADLIGRSVLDTIGPQLYVQRKGYIDRVLAGETVHFEMESISHGELRHLQATYLPDVASDGRVVGITTMSVDVTEMKAAQERLSQLARCDALTGLPNRLMFNERLEEALTGRAVARGSLGVMFLDVDRFKSINDSHGHGAGDAVLVAFAERIRHSVRPDDFVARLAGDEFVVILRNVASQEEAETIAARIILRMDAPIVVDDLRLRVTTSVGIAFDDERGETPATLLARADDALYRAKASGRNTFRVAGDRRPVPA